MLTLYVKTGCAYCAMVIHALEELDLKFEEKDIADEKNRDELIEKGGSKQTPCLIDEGTMTIVYESSDIVSYLMEHYSNGKDLEGKKEGESVV